MGARSKRQTELKIQSFLSQLRNYYKDRLVSVVLFGSVARGEETPESDIDILIVARGLSRNYLERVEEIVKNINYGADIQPVILDVKEASTHRPLYLDIIEEGEILEDKNGFIAGIFERMKKRLRDLGTVKIKLDDGSWYWKVKPDIKYGEIVEI